MNYEQLGKKLLSYNDPIYVCNPFTQETVRLPQLTLIKAAAKNDFLLIGFGYLNATKEYKIVRIFYYEDSKFCKGQVQVYTLGDKNGWRYKGITDHFLGKSNGVLCNGALYWIANMGTEIVAFDLADEKFRSVPMPPCFPIKYIDPCFPTPLQVLGGCLSIVLYRYSLGWSTDIWSLKPLMDSKKENDKLHWSNEFIIQFKDLHRAYYCPISLTEENKVLAWHMQMYCSTQNTLCHYDPKTATSEEFMYDDAGGFQIFQVIPYMKSDVSLTALVPDMPVSNWNSMN
ncbi:F-box protein At3g07870-like [Papaver somniferum]|uniref:F-box protein At3g07870-like n=1 Tax=Papaver somniferum TaxID=3469 RepID=UPI000E6F84CF|nr:F-box protein At3g07870-like [Papaver somniferum]